MINIINNLSRCVGLNSAVASEVREELNATSASYGKRDSCQDYFSVLLRWRRGHEAKSGGVGTGYKKQCV